MGAIFKVKKLTTLAEAGITLVVVAVILVGVGVFMPKKIANDTTVVNTNDSTIVSTPPTDSVVQPTTIVAIPKLDTPKPTVKAIPAKAHVEKKVVPQPTQKKTDARENLNVTF